MLKALDSQYKILEDGKICYQPHPTNPLPGEEIAYFVRGDSVLRPKVMMLDADCLKSEDRTAVRDHLEGWFTRHLQQVLEPLVALHDLEDLKGAARGIAFQVYEAMGIVPREQVEDLISSLSQEDRRALRAKKIRLGPILVFIPALNKPAAVRLRAMLWGLYNGEALPVACPKDGLVSFVVEPQAVNHKFYQSIGYPVFGSRAIRIDMLDRVISAVYDSAKDGKFQAQHTMAEWLGSTIDGLYEVLEAMGHRKIQAPVVSAAPEAIEAAPSESTAPAPEDGALSDLPVQPAALAALEQAPDKIAVAVKPELAFFRLKRGKAFEKASFEGAPKKNFHAKKSHSKPDERQGREQNKSSRKDAPPKGARKDKGSAKDPRPVQILQTGPAPKPEDSPFAILSQLKKKSDG